jgi:hypothetical protein
MRAVMSFLSQRGLSPRAILMAALRQPRFCFPDAFKSFTSLISGVVANIIDFFAGVGEKSFARVRKRQLRFKIEPYETTVISFTVIWQ